MITNADLVERAHVIIKRDAELVSGGPDLFWEQPCGLNAQEKQNFGKFYRMVKIHPELITNGNSTYEEVFEDYDDFAKRLRDDDQHDQKMLMVAQMTFMIIMSAAADRYQL